jgi:hypothetical protein|tara:strand:- start:169 stop:591 length:423 start_codon:yes stop_codon:yes gene_type:complete
MSVPFTVKDGAVSDNQMLGLMDWLRDFIFNAPDGNYNLLAELIKDSKTMAQLAYIHAVLIPYLSETYKAQGKVYNDIDVKDYFKLITGYFYYLKTSKGQIPQTLSFADADKAQVAKIIRFFEEYCIETFGEAPPSPRFKI